MEADIALETIPIRKLKKQTIHSASLVLYVVAESKYV